MKIAFDATAILGSMGKNRGIGNYTKNQFNHMIELDSSDEFLCLNFFEESIFDGYINKRENVTEEQLYTGHDTIICRDIEYENLLGDIIKKFINDNMIDVFYITSPFDTSIIPYKKEWFDNTTVVCTVYDVIPYALKEKYYPNNIGIEYYLERIDQLRWMDRLYVISDSVKADLIKYFSFDENSILTIWGAVDEKFKTVSMESQKKKLLYDKYGIQGDYILCTGGDDERKNIERLIKAYSKLSKDLLKQYQLVIVCKISNTSKNKYMEIAKQKHLEEDRVIFTNYVSDGDLVALYNYAKASAFVSIYEGFGLPVVESFACEVPVVTSNNSSLVEIAGDAAIIVDPYDVDDIKKGLNEACKGIDREEYIKKGKERLKIFNWDRVAKSVIKNLTTINTYNKKEARIIAFFSPLPPIESGISDFSVDVLNGIAKYFDRIDVFIDDGYKVNCKLEKNVFVYSYHSFESEQYDKVIYQVGNSDFHTYMFDALKKTPGIVELHDCNLHSLVRHITLGQGRNNLDAYKKLLSEDMTQEKLEAYLEHVDADGFSPYEVIINGFVSNYSDKMIVHSEWTYEWLIRKDFSRDISVINHYGSIKPIVDKKKFRNGLGINEDEIVIASFGIIHKTKRSMPALKALRKLRDDGYKFVFYYVGKYGEGIEEELNSYIKEYNMNSIVKVTGFISLKTFEEYMDCSDICINLRYPYNGETSGTCTRMLCKGKCTIVNSIGAFSEIPDNACVKLPNVETLTEEKEIELIYNSVKELIDNTTIRETIEKNAREYAEKNLDIEIISKQYLKVINEEYYHTPTERMLEHFASNELRHGSYSDDERGKIINTFLYTKK